MPILGLGLHVLIAICFAIHAVRTGQDRYWLFILFMFPGLGSLVYALAIWLPEVRHSRDAQRLVGGVRRMLDPGRELREAQDAFEVSPSADNRLRLADALLGAGQPAAAVDQLRAALRNVHSDDPEIQIRLAYALLEAGQPEAAREQLDAVRAARPDYRSADGHLIYARAVAGCGDHDQARDEFESLITYYAGFEPRARYAELLLQWGDRVSAQVLAQQSIKQASRLPKHARQLNRPWLERIERIARGESAAVT